ncbi:unnamed protein product [Vitrella brassicaformis CCMP3155]|uniref:Uncharacterized protein n=1 Tax=Vitrella brassicaformis (strain CCMP3155) TaxID=1169540 RepID=A0A0G4EZE4_VITBC|nr:unnamed protein product [Vitrella brassicaformis CCMP3155]|eukprot:CEM04466.1 unnamed protein product [Vitrella brassicaformis CCMP3155]
MASERPSQRAEDAARLIEVKAKLQAAQCADTGESPVDDDREDTELLHIKRQNQLKKRLREQSGWKPERGIDWSRVEAESISTMTTAPHSTTTSVQGTAGGIGGKKEGKEGGEAAKQADTAKK